MAESATTETLVQLTEDDIPGAKLSDPFGETHKSCFTLVAALPWDSSASIINESQADLKVFKVALCDTLLKIKYIYTCRIEQAKAEGAGVCDVDGTYLFRKQQQMIEAGVATTPLDIPDSPISEWELLKLENHKELSSKFLE